MVEVVEYNMQKVKISMRNRYSYIIETNTLFTVKIDYDLIPLVARKEYLNKREFTNRKER